jgi:hypothetical protein
VAQKSRATFEKRQKERARQEKQRDKQARRFAAAKEKKDAEAGTLGEDGAPADAGEDANADPQPTEE